ncbi:unnamed protein product, partial [Adineta steineri]
MTTTRRCPRYRPVTYLKVFNRQLHGFGDRLEYFIDSFAIARRILVARRLLITRNPMERNRNATIKTTIAMIINIGNPPVPEFFANIPPTTNNTILAIT